VLGVLGGATRGGDPALNRTNSRAGCQGVGPYKEPCSKAEEDIIKISKSVDDSRGESRPDKALSDISHPEPDTAGIKESDTGLAPPSQWDLVADKQVMQQENPLQVARCTKIINADTENAQ